jgi:hypothetical protein
MALRHPDTSEDRHEKEVAVLLALFHDFVISVANQENEWDTLEDLMEARADIMIRRALDGFGITFEDAIKLIREAEGLDSEQIAQRNIVMAAVDNLVDFSVVAEYQMADDMAELEEELSDEESEDMDDDDWKLFFLPVFKRFNDQYMRTENQDAEYSMIVAAFLAAVRDDTVLMYMTQGDERVRPWHLQYEGFTAPKSRFPAWLIPPIEYQCRCYLVEDTASIDGKSNLSSVQAMATPEMPDWFNRTFKESVALGGRIFSDEHPYFQVDERHVGRLNAIAKRIKAKYYDENQ